MTIACVEVLVGLSHAPVVKPGARSAYVVGWICLIASHSSVLLCLVYQPVHCTPLIGNEEVYFVLLLYVVSPYPDIGSSLQPLV